MGCEVVVGGATASEVRKIERLFAERDRMFSRFRADSELSRVNRAAGVVVKVSPSFAGMVEVALRAARETDGLVDPTLGDAVEAAGYDRDFVELQPSPRTAGRGACGRWRSLRATPSLLHRPHGVLLDLNGVVKGKTVDDALDLIGGDGYVSAGGDLAARGAVDVALPDGGGCACSPAAWRHRAARSGAGCARARGSTTSSTRERAGRAIPRGGR